MTADSIAPTATERHLESRAPRVAAIHTFALLAVVGGALSYVALTRGLFDPDYFWHLATGRLILGSGAVPTVDPFSFTWAGQPWVPDQWLAEVVVAAAIGSIGVGATIIAFALVAAIGPVAVAAAALRRGAAVLPVAGATIVVAAAMVPQVTIRPQVLSFGLLGVLLAFLILARPEWRLGLWLPVPLFWLWANLHGFYVVGLAVGLIYVVATALGRTPLGPRRVTVILVGLVSVGVTMLTPSGPGGLFYSLSFADPSDLGALKIQEWQSPNFHNPQFLAFLLVVLLVLAGGKARRPGWIWATAILGVALGLFASRAVGVGVLLAMPLLVMPNRSSPSRSVVGTTEDRRAILELCVATFTAIVLVGAALLNGPVRVDPRRVPTVATGILAAAKPAARVLASYEWGGYLIEQLHDRGGTVFVDGRMHKYAGDVLRDYVDITSAAAGWDELLSRYGVEAILLDPDTTLVKGMAQNAGWCERYRDDVQVLLLPCRRSGS